MKKTNLLVKLHIGLIYLLFLPITTFSQDILNIRRTLNASFDGLIARSNVNVYLTQNDKEDVRVEAREDIHKYIRTEVNNGILSIYTDDLPRKWNWNDNEKINVFVNFKTLKKVEAHGASDVIFENQLITPSLDLNIHGSSDVRMNLKTNRLTCEIHGSSDAVLSGTVQELSANIHGSSDFKAYDLKIQNCQINISGSADAQITVNGDLEAQVSGSSDLNYQGNPNIKKMIVSGSGDARRRQ